MRINELTVMEHTIQIGDTFTTEEPNGIVFDSDTVFEVDGFIATDQIAYVHTSVKQKINKVCVCSLALFAIRLERYGLTVKTSKAKDHA
ncbi:hypothetical protein [Pedobacter duraquae]|nr:hypothetical protein [Pedobacter duraquae]